MSNLTITNIDLGNVILKSAEFEDGLLTFAGAGTVLAGTILARDSVSLKFIPFVKGGSTNENGIPKAVVTYDIVATGAGDIAIRAMIKGNVKKSLLIIDADGDDSNIDLAVRDQLRNYNINVFVVLELTQYDNQ